MSKIKDVIAATVFPIIKTVGKIEMSNVLFSIKSHNTTEFYKTTLQGLHSNFSILREVALKSKTRIDDGIIDLVLEAVKENADAEGIVLS